MVRIYYEYVTIITYATRWYYDDYDLITNPLRPYCRIMTLPIPLRRYFTCNSTRETFHERWRMPRTCPNLVGMQDDIKKNVSDSTTNPLRIENDGLHCEFVGYSCFNGIGVSYWARDARNGQCTIYLMPHAL